MQGLCVHTLLVQTQWQLLFVHIAAEMCQNLKPIFFEKNALERKNETQLCRQIYTHKIVHSSAM